MPEQVNPIPTPQFVSTPKFNFTKVLATVGLVAIAVIIIAGGAWIYVENQAKDNGVETDNTMKIASISAKPKTATSSVKIDENTKDWVTISSNTCGFSVKHPKDWSTAKEIDKGIFLVNVAELGGTVAQFRISLNCSNSDAIKAQYDKIKTYPVGKATEVKPTYQISNEMDTYTRLVDTTIDGSNTVRTKIDFGYKDVDQGDGYMVYIIKNNKIILVDISGGIKLDEKVKVLDQILSTFKFL